MCAQPTPYTRQADFSDYQASAPSDPLVGSDVDLEFDSVKTTLDEILTNLAVLQRDDTALANSSVHKDAFDADALALIGGSTGWTPKGDWATATSYSAKDLVRQGSTTYVAVEDHTSGTFSTDKNNGKWLALFTNKVRVDSADDTAEFLADKLVEGAGLSITKKTSGSTKTLEFSAASENLYAADAGSADAYEVTLDPAPSGYTAGMVVRFRAANTNTGASTIDVNGLGAATIKRNHDGTDLQASDIQANAIYELIYDGTNFRLADVIADGEVDAAALATDAVTNAKIAAGAVDTAELAADAVTNAKIAAGAVDTTELAADAVTTAKIAAGAVDTTELAADAVTNAKVASSAIGQGELKDSTGSVSTTNDSGGENLTLPGGQYGFYPQGQQDNPRTWSAAIGESVVGAGAYVTNILLETSISTDACQARQRYVTASPPFDMGDGLVHGFMFVLMRSGAPVASYIADVPPWAYNGPTDIRAYTIDKSGRKFRRVRRAAGLANLLCSGAISVEEAEERAASPEFQGFDLKEITHEIKNRDMGLIPHPFASARPGDTVILLDPMNELVGGLLEAQEEGENIADLIIGRRQIIRPDNEPLNRQGPLGVMQVRIKS